MLILILLKRRVEAENCLPTWLLFSHFLLFPYSSQTAISTSSFFSCHSTFSQLFTSFHLVLPLLFSSPLSFSFSSSSSSISFLLSSSSHLLPLPMQRCLFSFFWSPHLGVPTPQHPPTFCRCRVG